jgi:tRNA A-37 threonylcarbamoyl transferase component Bud32
MASALDPKVIQDHLDDCDRCRLVLAEAVRSATGADGATVPFRTLRDGQSLLGRYEIRRFIARGGMGEVYEAFDSVLGERVALKTLLPTALDDERAVERLLAEVRLARKVTHANVCRILEFGVYRHGDESGAGIPFLTMEFLTGEPLSRRVAARGKLPLATIVTLVKDAAAGLAAIHAAGIVHRDFKSENVFLVPDGAGGERAVIMDFGLARGFGGEARRGSSSTAAAGTPDYMAPEQVEGKPPTPAFDVYALGVVIFEMVTGQKPFAGASPYMAALSRLQRPAPAPSALVPGLSPGWDAVVGRCLERQPERRFARVEEIASALAAAAGGKSRSDRRWLVRGAAAFGLVALAAVVAGSRFTGAPRPSPAAARAKERAPYPVSPPAASPAPASPPGPPAVPVAVSVAPAATPSGRHRPASTIAASTRARPAGAARSRVTTPAPPRPPQEPAAKAPEPVPTAQILLREAQALMVDDVARACERGERAAALQPDLPAAQLFLGKCYIRLGDSEKARVHYRRYLQLVPDAPDKVFVRAILDGHR